MAQRTIVIVGGVAAGASAAAKARRCDEEANIIVLEKGPHISYANCGLPYYLGGVITDRRQLLITDAEFFRERFNVEVRTGSEVTAVDRGTKTVTVREKGRGEYRQPYDRLILATGADPVMPPVPGIGLPFVFSLRSLEDTDRIERHLRERRPAKAVILGGGLIGIEMMENLAGRGMEVAVVDHNPHILKFMDPEMVAGVEHHARSRGATLLLGEEVIAIHDNGQIETTSGRMLPADLVVVGIGIRPAARLAREAGLATGPFGGIRVNEFMESSDPNIFAAGDCVESVNLVTGKPALVPMGSAANKQGRAAGANAAGRRIAVPGFTGTVIVKVFDLTVAKTGLSEKEALAEGFDPLVTYVLAGHHAGYYPGARTLRMKVVADRSTGRLLGGQVVGEEGVDKRIDVLATAVYCRMQAEDLIHLDLAYAPPYSSARDPVVVAGALCQNAAAGDWNPITPAALHEKRNQREEFTLVDVRTAGELKRSGVIPGAVHIPVDELRARLRELDPRRPTVLYCAVGLRSYIGSRILALAGFADVRTLTGGFSSWIYDTEPFVRGR